MLERLLITLKNAKAIRLLSTENGTSLDALLGRIERARAATLAPAALEEFLAKSTQTTSDWIAGLRRLSVGDYRSPAVPDERLWQVLLNAGTASARIAAALLLRSRMDESALARLRSISDTTASSELRGTLALPGHFFLLIRGELVSIGGVSHASGWEMRFDRFVQPFLEAWRHKKRRQWAPVYLRGLLLPGERKSIEPLAARVAPGHDQELRHFISESAWDPAEIEEVLWDKADAMLGDDDAVLIIDDTALPKKGVESVGVAHQYCGALGKQASCQCLVSATLAKDDVPVPVALRLYLPEAWANDKKRRAKVDVPDDVEFKPKWRIALDEVRRLKKAGVRFGTVLADAGYGTCADFRRGLGEEGLLWAVGIISEQKLYPANAGTRMPRNAPVGPRRKRPVPTHARRSAKDIIAQRGEKAWRRISWRNGTKGPLAAEFIAVRVRAADGPETTDRVHLPGDEAWLVAERRSSGEVKYYLTNHPATASLKSLASAIKARWSCEQAHQQLKEELGLDHFEGRTWRGLHHHALMTLICFAFLQQERLRENKSAA